MAFLSLKNISRSFGSTRAVADVSLNVNQGEFFGLLGPSGCGKTTTLRMIAGLEKPDSGSIEFQGSDITNLPPERRGFGMVFQNYALFPHLNVFDNVAFGLRARHKTKAEMAERVASALELVQLPGYAKRAVDELSGGQQQRVAIARALVNEPRIVFADEPTGNLDSRTGEAILQLFRELSTQGRTIALVTHDPDIAAVTPRKIEIRDGKIASQLDPKLAGLDRQHSDSFQSAEL
jgi:ABC-type Fe3+/spermidine/putrescine transport system ATPase subunit